MSGKTFLMMMNCFCGMVDRRKAFSLISSRDHCQRSSPSRISDTPRAGFEPAQNLSSGLVELSCAVVIITTPRCHCIKRRINNPVEHLQWRLFAEIVNDLIFSQKSSIVDVQLRPTYASSVNHQISQRVTVFLFIHKP